MFKQLLVLSMLLNGTVNTDRSEFTHEILDASFVGDQLVIKGWAVMQNTQHFEGLQTHDFEVKLQSNDDVHTIAAELWDANLTQLMEYRGIPMCAPNTLNRDDCNYRAQNVGFIASIPLTQLHVDNDYVVSIVMRAKHAFKTYESPVHYYTQTNKILEQEHRIYELNSNINLATFRVFHNTVVVRSEPFVNTDTPTINYGSCSSGYGTTAFFKKDSYYTNVRKVIQNGLVKSYEVGVMLDQCDGLRNRVREGSDKIGYIQSNFIDYTSDPLIVKVATVKRNPQIIAEDKWIKQYDVFDPYKDVSVVDGYGLDQTKDLQLIKDRVNTRIPGVYTVDYGYQDIVKTINVTVEPIDVIYRYVNEKTHNDLVLWQKFRTVLEQLLQRKR